MTLTLGTIAEEAAACRAAFAARPRARYAAHVHHEAAVEALTESVEERIAYILARKPADEQALRLHCLRPITVRQWRAYRAAERPAWEAYTAAVAAWETYEAAMAAWEIDEAVERAAHDAICPVAECPWDGRTIFPEQRL